MRLIKRLAMGVVNIALLATTCFFIYLHSLKQKADQIVRSSYELSQQGYRPTLADLRQRFGAELKQSSPCTAWGCGYEVIVSNRLLARLNLADYSVLDSSFWTRGNVVDENVLSVFTVRNNRGIVAYVDTKYCEGCKGFVVTPCEGSMASMASASVRIGSGSGLNERRTAFGFNTECLSSLRACASIAELLPSVWQSSPTGTVQCASSEGVSAISQ
jgi:hypothetical protein